VSAHVGSGFGRLAVKGFERGGNSFHRRHAWMLDVAARDPSERVVVNASMAGDCAPLAGALDRLQGGDDLFKLHGASLGAAALRVKASPPKACRHDSDVSKAKEKAPPATVFHANLRRLIGEESVNAWAKKHTLEQTTIQRLYDGSDPKLSMIERIAGNVGAAPWQLLAPDFGAGLFAIGDDKVVVPMRVPATSKQRIGRPVSGGIAGINDPANMGRRAGDQKKAG